MSHVRVDSVTSEELTRQKVSRLLGTTIFNPFRDVEEKSHPWAVNQLTNVDFPLLRVWDVYSGSVPGDNSKMSSRAPDEPLQTRAARRTSLKLHLKHSNWEIPTPYISFTSSPEALSKLAYQRDENGNRQEQFVTVIDPQIRIKRGFPVLDVAVEMKHYNIVDPYNRGNEYYSNHYVCLWEVTPEEVVGRWSWDDLASTDNWYENVILPEFRRFRNELVSTAALAPSTLPEAAFDMAALKEVLLAPSPTESTVVRLETERQDE